MEVLNVYHNVSVTLSFIEIYSETINHLILWAYMFVVLLKETFYTPVNKFL